MIRSLPAWVGVVVVGFPLLLAVMSFAFSLYISKRYLDAMVEALKGSRHIVIGATGLLTSGVFGRFLLIAKICGAITWPRGLIRSGEMDAREVQVFPRLFKSMIKAKIIISGGALLWGVVVAVLLQIEPM